MEQIPALRVALLDALAAERLVLDLEGGKRLHGAAFQLLAVLIRDRAATDRTTTIVNASPAIEALLGLGGLSESGLVAPDEAAA
jgi:anti-anti-sigma regulatory factor